MEEMDIIGTTFGTEKWSSRHDYLRNYDHLFARFRREPLNFIETGVFNQTSLATGVFISIMPILSPSTARTEALVMPKTVSLSKSVHRMIRAFSWA
jgi:hypothetical protein